MGAYFASLNFASLPARMPSAIAQGILWGLMALGVYITFRLLDVADLSVDGSFATGGAVTVMLIIAGWPAWAAQLAALLVGGASVEKASIKNVFLGVILFHTMFIVAPRTGTVITGDSMIGEYFRVFVSYAVITIALVMYEAKKRKAKSAAGLQLAADQLAEEEAKAK